MLAASAGAPAGDPHAGELLGLGVAVDVELGGQPRNQLVVAIANRIRLRVAQRDGSEPRQPLQLAAEDEDVVDLLLGIDARVRHRILS
jgi:hypothetical protein